MNLFPFVIAGCFATLSPAGASSTQAHCGTCDAAPAGAAEACEACKMQADDYTIQLGMSGYSPVSYLDQQKAEPGSPVHAAVYQGVTYFFVSGNQRAAFEKDPQRYMPAYGGYCAFGCSVDSLFVPDPTSFEVINGRTHLFLKNQDVDARALWQAGDRGELLRKADAYWDGQAKRGDGDQTE